MFFIFKFTIFISKIYFFYVIAIALTFWFPKRLRRAGFSKCQQWWYISNKVTETQPLIDARNIKCIVLVLSLRMCYKVY